MKNNEIQHVDVDSLYTETVVATLLYNVTGGNIPCNSEQIDNKDSWCREHCNPSYAYGEKELNIYTQGINCWKHALQCGWLKEYI